MKKGRVIVISGPSGVGKSSIRERLINEVDNLCYSISMTTREARSGEVDGIDYYFVSKDVFLENIENNNFIEYEEVYNGTYYGTLKSFVNDKISKGISVILEIDVKGARNIRNIYPDALLIFIAPPSFEVLEDRLKSRNTDSDEKIKERLKKASFEMSYKEKYDYVVINNDIDEVVSSIKKIIEK